MNETRRKERLVREMAELQLQAERASLARKEAHAYHGLPFLETALHLGDSEYDYNGKKAVIFGYPFGRSNIVDKIAERGGTAIPVGMEQVATNAKNPFSKKPLLELEQKAQYDQLALYMGLALYSPERQEHFLPHYLNAVDYERGGEAHFVSSDFTGTEAHASQIPAVNNLLKVVDGFFKTSGMDKFQGKSAAETVRASLGSRTELEVTETIHERPAGPQYWPELRDLFNMLAKECDDAVAELQGAPLPIRLLKTSEFLKTKKRLLAQIKNVDTILNMPEEERPDVQPPVFHTVTVKKAEKVEVASEPVYDAGELVEFA